MSFSKFTKTVCLISMTAMILQGCVSGAVYSMTTNKELKTLNDNIRYIVNPVVNGQRNSDELIILGDNYSYRIWGQDTEDLEWLAKTLNPKFIKASPIQLTAQKQSTTVSFHFEYDTQGRNFNHDEAILLDKYCTNINNNSAKSCIMRFNSQMHDKYTPKQTLTPLQGNYPISITVRGNHTFTRALLMPLAIATDIVTSPIQLLSGGAYIGGFLWACTSNPHCVN